ncbi:MAG: hypothetical protein LBH55_00230 [Mycoplasmataceae bacterium]|jgi:ribonuclease-3|nr:hypothetical protein [Mycoplasmataceae bacterium]
MSRFKELFQKLEIVDCEEKIFEEAFTHPTYSHDHNLNYSYDRLEYFGDAIISKIVAEYLFNKYKDSDSGAMSVNRSLMVQSRSFIKTAKDLNFDKYVKVGVAIQNQNIFPEKIFEDIFEAFICAIYLTFGEESAKKVIFKTIITSFENNEFDDNNDFKTMLKHLCKDSEIEYIKKQKDDSVFIVDVLIDSKLIASATAHKMKDAENDAAHNAYKILLGHEIAK